MQSAGNSSTDKQPQEQKNQYLPDYEPEEEGTYNFPPTGLNTPSFGNFNLAGFNNSNNAFFNNQDFTGFNPVSPSPLSFNPFAAFPPLPTFADFMMSDQPVGAIPTSTTPLGFNSNGQDNGTGRRSITPIAQNTLDSRAAELKQQLLKKRELAAAKVAAAAVQHGQNEKSQSGSARSFIPHVPPRPIQELRQPSFTANDSDIAALIADISGAAAEEAAKDLAKVDAAKDKQKVPDENMISPGVDANISANGTPKETQKVKRTTDIQHPVNDGAKLRIEGSAKHYSTSSRSTPTIPSSHKPESSASKALTLRTSHLKPNREEGELSSSSTTPTDAKQSNPSIKIESKKRDHPESTGERPTRLGISQQVGVPKTESSKPASMGIDANDQDLQDWLVFTNWYDVEYRASLLARRRRLALIEEEKKQLIAEEEAMHPFMRQQSATGLAATPLQPTHGEAQIADPALSIHVPTATKSDALGQPEATTSAATKRGYDVQQGDETGRSGDKRPRFSNNHQQSNEEVQDRDGRPYDSYKSTDSNDYSYGRRPSTSRKWSPNRGTHHKSYYHNDHRPDSRGGRYQDRGGYSREDHWDRGRLERSRSPARRSAHGQARGHSRGRSYGQMRGSRPLDLGRKGESRFFMVKSFNEANVRHCMKDGMWTTQLQNGEKITKAFDQCKNVILIFSINKSKAFQGYARMDSVPSPDAPRPAWMKNIHWKTTHPFRVEWFNEANTEFRYVHHLQNSLLVNLETQDQSVIIGKDGQEIEEDCARELVRLMDKTAQMARYQDGSRDEDDGGYHDLEKKSGFVKREAP